MNELEIRPVRSDREFRTFLQLPRRLYKKFPHYCPPLDYDRRQIFDRRHNPFFTHGTAEYWIAYRGRNAVGRISAQIDDLHAQVGEADLGMFGAFDATDDTTATASLLDAACRWLAQQGKTRVRGPFNLSISAESGLLVEGQSEPAMVLYPWHPPYLRDHLVAAGWEVERQLLSYCLDRSDEARQKKKMVRQQASLPAGFKMRPLNPSRGLDEFLELGTIYNSAWRGNWGFVPMNEADIAGLRDAMRPVLRPDNGIVVEKDGRPVAFTIILPNIMEYVTSFGGQLSVLKALKLLWRIKLGQPQYGRTVLAGIEPEFQGGSTGAAIVMSMMGEFLRLAKKYNGSGIEFGWIVEDNRRTLAAMSYFGGRLTRRFEVFQREIGEAVPLQHPNAQVPT